MLAFGSNTLGYRTSHMSSRGTPVRSYDRTWEEIENMLNKAEAKRAEWKAELLRHALLVAALGCSHAVGAVESGQ